MKVEKTCLACGGLVAYHMNYMEAEGPGEWVHAEKNAEGKYSPLWLDHDPMVVIDEMAPVPDGLYEAVRKMTPTLSAISTEPHSEYEAIKEHWETFDPFNPPPASEAVNNEVQALIQRAEEEDREADCS